MFQRNNTNHTYDHRRTFIIQHIYFTYQRKSNQEVGIQLINTIVTYLQHQTNNITSAPGGSDPNTDIGVI